jgi:hypothetical protein
MKRIYINENDLSTLNKFEIGFDKGDISPYGHVINEDVDKELKDSIDSISQFMKDEGLNVYPYPEVELNNDEQKDGVFISTGHYEPEYKKIVLYCKDRHIKDILRSYAHEMIHHMQNLDGKKLSFFKEDNVNNNKELEKLESEAYLKGNIYFRRWTEINSFKNDKGHLDEEITADDVDVSSFNTKDALCYDLWDGKHLKSDVRMKLLNIADDFIDYLDVDWVKPSDIILTGSLCNYNWSEYSDIDLHIVMDFNEVDENVKLLKGYFDSKKSTWNIDHDSLLIYGFPVELYVQDINEPHNSSGVYSLEKDEWVIEPDPSNVSTNDIDFNIIKDSVAKFTNKIDELADMLEGEEDMYILSLIQNMGKVLLKGIKDCRKKGFEKTNKEMNEGNLVFKALRRNDSIQKLYDILHETYDKMNSL